MEDTYTFKLEPLLVLSEVIEITRLSRAAIYVQMAENTFPAPVKLGRRHVAWRPEDIRAWIDTRPIATYGEANG